MNFKAIKSQIDEIDWNLMLKVVAQVVGTIFGIFLGFALIILLGTLWPHVLIGSVLILIAIYGIGMICWAKYNSIIYDERYKK